MLYKESTHSALAMICLLLSISVPVVHAERPGCDNAMAKTAENEGANLKTWVQVYDAFKRYSACDEAQ